VLVRLEETEARAALYWLRSKSIFVYPLSVWERNKLPEKIRWVGQMKAVNVPFLAGLGRVFLSECL
jgi:hypothetical protein